MPAMKNIIITSVIFGFAFILLSSCQQKSKPISLRLKYDKGDMFIINYHVFGTTGASEEQLNEEMEMMFTVDSIINDSLYILSSKIGHIRVKNHRYQRSEIYSSAKRRT